MELHKGMNAMKLWGKLIIKQKIVLDAVVENIDPALSDEKKRKYCLEELCYGFDIPYPLWLPHNEKEYGQYKKTSFHQDHFIEIIDFERFEIEIITDR